MGEGDLKIEHLIDVKVTRKTTEDIKIKRRTEVHNLKWNALPPSS
jgi:hypothetical protein